MIYLMTPYSNPDPEVRELYFEWAKLGALLFFYRGVTVYSPIVHWHPVACTYNLPVSQDYWELQDNSMLSLAESCVILTLPGWGQSQGIQTEISFAAEKAKPLRFLSPKELLLELKALGVPIPQVIALQFPELFSEPAPVSDR